MFDELLAPQLKDLEQLRKRDDMFDELLAPQLKDLEQLTKQVDTGGYRLQSEPPSPPEAVHQQIVKATSRMRNLFPGARLVPAPKRLGFGARVRAHARYWQIRYRIGKKEARSFWDELTGPTAEPLLTPNDPQLTEAWWRRRREMISKKLPRLRGATDEARQRTAEGKAQGEAIVSNLQKSREIVIHSGIPARRRSLTRRIFDVVSTLKLSAFRERAAVPRQATDLETVLRQDLPQLTQLEHGVRSLERQLEREWPAFLEEVRRIDPSTCE